MVETQTVDDELKLLLRGVRVLLVALVVLVMLAIPLLGPHLLHHPQAYGDGQCTLTGAVGVCVIP
jgi:hypothetical protein